MHAASLKQLANQLADAARAAALPHFGEPLVMHKKDDDSPVTRADREAEQAMRELLRELAPEHGVIGEEFGARNEDAEFVWVLDPIDGTKAFITGKPLWGTLIGLMRNRQPVLGVIDLGALDRRWVGMDATTTENGVATRTSTQSDLTLARVGCTSPQMFNSEEHEVVMALIDEAWFCSWGGDCAAYATLASGHLDLVVEADLAPYDYMALIAVVGGAGGVITDWHGQALTGDGYARVVAAANPALHEQALTFLSRARLAR